MNVLPRGPFREVEEQDELTPELARAVEYLASCRHELDTMKQITAELHEMLLGTDLGSRYMQAQEDLEGSKCVVEEAENAVRYLALSIFSETTERRPHGAVLVKHYTVPTIKDEDELFQHVRVHVPQCVKLDKREVKKVAKVIPLPGVEIVDEYRATIQRDLSDWLPVISQDELDYHREAK
jgi:hypothetical protein